MVDTIGRMGVSSFGFLEFARDVDIVLSIYHTLCHLQPYPTKTSALHLEPGLDSQMLRHPKAFQVTYLWYQSLMMALLNRASPLSVLFKEVLWIPCVVLNQIESQSEFVMMTVSAGTHDF